MASWISQAIARIDPQRPVLLAGATASGKSALAMAIAEAQGGTIVNADALQVYDCWRILTARPTADDAARVPHRLFGHVARDAAWSAGHWLRAVAPLLGQSSRPIITGGTGLYFAALTEGLAELPEIPPAIRAEGEDRLAREGLDALLAALDPATRRRIDTANPARVLRAWEVLRATGRGLADWQAATPAPLLPLAAAQPLVLEVPPARLAARIDRRFDAMMAAGALEEVAAELPHWSPQRPSARAIGAAELAAHLRGEIPRDAAVAAAKLATRRYAKRQRTWMRNRMGLWHRITPNP